MANKLDSIEVIDLDGHAVNLLDLYKNTHLVILIYNNDCLGCTGRAIPMAYEFSKKYKNICFVGVHANFPHREANKKDILEIFTYKTLPFPIYIDPDDRVYNQFKAEGTPQWIIIDKEAVLYKSIFGSQENAQNRLFYTLEGLSKQEMSSS